MTQGKYNRMKVKLADREEHIKELIAANKYLIHMNRNGFIRCKEAVPLNHQESIVLLERSVGKSLGEIALIIGTSKQYVHEILCNRIHRKLFGTLWVEDI